MSAASGIMVLPGKETIMSNDFFNNHPMLGSVFDFDHDGSMSLGEAGAMAAMGSLIASEYMRVTEDDELDSKLDGEFGDVFDGEFGDALDDEDSSFTKRGKNGRKPQALYDDNVFDDEFVEYDENRVYEIDASDASVVMDAVVSGDFDEADIEYLVREALCGGVEFDRDDAEEILEYISERDLRDWIESFLD